MNATVLGLALWAGAVGGVVAVVVAIATPRLRRVLLVVAALLFLPIGILGILSIGVVFLVAAVVCLLVAALDWRGTSPTTPSRGR